MQLAQKGGDTNVGFAEELLQCGADASVERLDGASAKDVAAREGHHDLRITIARWLSPLQPFTEELLTYLFSSLRPQHRNVVLRVNLACRDAVRAGVACGIFTKPAIDYDTAVIVDFFGSSGAEEGKIKCARGLAMIGDDKVVVAEQDTRRVQMFSVERGRNGTTHDVKLASVVGGEGQGVGKFSFNGAFGVCVQDDRMFASSPGNKCINVYTLQGRALPCVGKGILQQPFGLAVNKQRDIAVVDSAASAIFIFNSLGKVLMKFSEGLTSKPYGVSFFRGDLIVTQQGDSQVLHMSTAQNSVRTIATIPCGGSARGVAVDSEGNILVTSPETKKLHIFAPGHPQHYLLRSFTLKDYSYALTVHATFGVLLCGYNSGQVSRLCCVDKPSEEIETQQAGSHSTLKCAVQRTMAKKNGGKLSKIL